jgi:8-oxo-dGTP pyrophosphatase MutT (NUDIX family)
MAITRWKTTASKYLHDRWMSLRADRCETASGIVIAPYYVQEPADWVQIVAFDALDRILLTRQYRHGAGLISTEIPCGAIERGETPDQAAARELLEETGCTAQTLQPLPALSPNPARYSNRIHAFIAIDARQVQPQRLAETEEIEFVFRSVADVLALIDAGTFPQALHVASVFLALRRRGFISAAVP